MFPKALRSGADIVCADLEDAVPPRDKAAAREIALAHLPGAAGPASVERVVRINCLRTLDGMADVQALLASPHRIEAGRAVRGEHRGEDRGQQEEQEDRAPGEDVAVPEQPAEPPRAGRRRRLAGDERRGAGAGRRVSHSGCAGR